MKRGNKFRLSFLTNECLVTCVRKGIVYFIHNEDRYQLPLVALIKQGECI